MKATAYSLLGAGAGVGLLALVSACVTPQKQAAVHEAFVPVASTALAGGLDGKAVALERLTAADVGGCGATKALGLVAWRNERVNGQVLVWSGKPVKGLSATIGDFVSVRGERIPASAARLRFVRWTRASHTRDGKVLTPETFVGDCLDDGAALDLPANGFRPVWLTVNVPKDAPAATYKTVLRVAGACGAAVEFPVTLDVRHEVLPDPKDWSFFLDLWQHPWAVARYEGLKPFSAEHYAALKPLYRELASAGQKTITTTLIDRPWNKQNYDAYGSMVAHAQRADGTFAHDYSLFDEYVAFAQGCGLGPQIHCYTMVPWGNVVRYAGADGKEVAVEMKPGTAVHEKFWGPFLADFQKHVAAKGWLGRVYIALDERSPEELKAAADCIRRHAPGLKIQMAGNKAPSAFGGVSIDNYSQAMRSAYLPKAFLDEAAARRAKGQVTTAYICCSPAHPNTFTTSPLAEAAIIGPYLASVGLDGLLRWSAFNWPADPFADSSYGKWPAGDTFLLYPGARASTRWEVLRDSIEDFEKIRFFNETKQACNLLKTALAKIDLKTIEAGNYTSLTDMLGRVSFAIDDHSTPGEFNGRRIEYFMETYGAACGYAKPVKEVYVVQHPVPAMDKPGRPLYVVLHSSGHNAVRALNCTKAPDNHDIYLSPDDFFSLFLDCKMLQETEWWYGYDNCHGFDLSTCEKRMLKTIEDVVVKYGIDRDRIYLCGNSMGGSGCLGFGLRNGDLFAAIKGNVPALVEHACDRMGWDMKTDANAAGIDWTKRLAEPPILIHHTAPNDMRWSEGHEHLFRMMRERRYPWMALWADHKHCNKNSIITNANDIYLSFDWTKVKKSDLLPAFTGAHSDTVCPWPHNREAKGAGEVNGFFRWANGKTCAKAASIDLFIADLTSRSFKVPATDVVDVTLWRKGAFKVVPGEKLNWSYDGKSGTVVVDAFGRVTIPQLEIAKKPRKLVVTK